MNLKLELLNYFDLTRCLCELKTESGESGITAPKEYISDGNWDNVDFDAFDGVSYWRLRDEITTTPLENAYKAGKRVEITVPLKLVFSVRREKLTADDAYSYDRIRQTIVKQFNIDDGDLKTSLGAEKILITSPTANGDAKEVWDGETANTGTFEPKYEVVFGSVDIDKSLIAPVIYGDLIILSNMKNEIIGINLDNGKIDFRKKIHKKYDFKLYAIPWGGAALDEKNGIYYTVTGNPKPYHIGIFRPGENAN